MAEREGIPVQMYKHIFVTVSTFYDTHGCVTMLKCLFKDLIYMSDLCAVKETSDMLEKLHSSGVISRKNLTLFHNIIKLTRKFELEDKIREILPSFPNVKDIDIDTENFSKYRQRVMKFTFSLREEDTDPAHNDVSRLNKTFNNPKRQYTDRWHMMLDFEAREILKEKYVDKFLNEIKELHIEYAAEAFLDGSNEDSPNGKRKTGKRDEGESSCSDEPPKKKQETSFEKSDNGLGEPSCSDEPPKKKKETSVEKSDNGLDKSKCPIEKEPKKLFQEQQGCIMISYNHKHDILAKKIKGSLEKLKFNVWIDDPDKMCGDAKEKMRHAVKDASLILVCISEHYEKSENCKYECDRIVEYEKPFIPLIMQKYERNDDSWVKQLIGDLVYIDFASTKYGYEDNIRKLVKHIEAFKEEKELPNLMK